MKKLLVVLSAAVLAAALSAAVAQGPLHSGASGASNKEALYLQARNVFVKHLSAHAPPIRAQAASPAGAPLLHGHGAAAAALPTANSSGRKKPLPSVNWSGYADVDSSASSNASAPGTLSGVSADWTIPKVSCPQGQYRNQDAFAAQWVGLDGATNGTVEQLGTGEQCYEDVLYYYVWYEMFPAGTVQEGTQACINNNVDCPRPGDQISASVNAPPAAPATTTTRWR